MEKLKIVYIPCSSINEAKSIAKELLKSKLIACANIHESVSLFFWEGKLQETKEYVIMAKTIAKISKKLEQKIKSLHSYDCPCIISFENVTTNKEFMLWCERELVGNV